MEKKNTSLFYNGLVWGLILGFVSIIFSVILYMLDQMTNNAFMWVGLAISIVILIFGMRSFRDQIRGGVLPFGQAFGFGVIAFLVSGLLGSIFTYIMFEIIDPELITKIRDTAIEKAVERSGGRAPVEAIEEGMEMMSFMFKPVWMAIMGFFSVGFMGAIISLILAAIFKKDEDPELLAAEEAAADNTETPSE